MNKKYDTLVFLARFQPLHTAHLEIIKRACHLATDLVIIIGSANQPRTYKNPFTSAEREDMVRTALKDIDVAGCRVFIEHNVDTIYNDRAWITRVQGIVSKYYVLGGKTGIIGHKKDRSSFYLDVFPQWEFENVDLIEPLHATDVRDIYLRPTPNLNFLRGVVPPSTLRWLETWATTDAHTQVVRERQFIDKYKQQWAVAPYPVTFVCGDAVVMCSGHVLMIERRSEPGKHLLAFPGGFLEQHELIEDCVLRELKEETNIKVPAPVLRGSIVATKVFDHPDRSARGRTISHAYLIALPDGPLPKVRGGDDAKSAQWIPIADVTSEMCFDDHYSILQTFVGV